MFITAVCVLFLIKLRWPNNKSLYDTVFERYGQETLKLVRDYEKDLSRFNKASLDIGFLQKCKLFHIFPTFLNFKLSKEEFHATRACRRFKVDLLNYEWMLLKAGNGERGTGNGERGTGNGERESGNECTAVFRITIQKGGRRKRRTRIYFVMLTL